jgi:hypothetical protein
MKSKTCSVELVNEHILDDAIVSFRRAHNLERLGKLSNGSANVIRNKLTPTCTTHHITLDNAVAWSVVTNDISMLTAALNSLDYGTYKIETAETKTSLLSCVFSTVGTAANIAGLYDKAMTDGVLDSAERAQILKAVDDAERKLQELRGKLGFKAA